MSKIKLIFALMFCMVSLSFAQEELPKSATTTWKAPKADTCDSVNCATITTEGKGKMSVKEFLEAGGDISSDPSKTQATLTDRLLKGCPFCVQPDYPNLFTGGGLLPANKTNGPLLDPNNADSNK